MPPDSPGEARGAKSGGAVVPGDGSRRVAVRVCPVRGAFAVNAGIGMGFRPRLLGERKAYLILHGGLWKSPVKD